MILCIGDKPGVNGLRSRPGPGNTGARRNIKVHPPAQRSAGWEWPFAAKKRTRRNRSRRVAWIWMEL